MLKRLLDVFVSVTVLLILAPVIVLIGLFVRLDSFGPVLFVHTRIGLNRQPFRMLKFRSMVFRSPDQIDQLSEPILRSGCDFRVTRVGRILRATSLDELPQLWNVIRGDMSLVGPRPILPEQLQAIPARYEQRFSVRPGVTGLAQVLGRQALEWPRKLLCDVVYARRVSLRLDLWIVLKTMQTVVNGSSVYYETPGGNWRCYLPPADKPVPRLSAAAPEPRNEVPQGGYVSHLRLMAITNSPDTAQRVLDAGVDRIFVDLETRGKQERQRGWNAHLAHHSVDDILRVRRQLPTAEILVRCNPLHQGSEQEIRRIVDNGADIVMLPMFQTTDQVRTFAEMVGSRARRSLLLETATALARLSEFCDDPLCFEELHVGLNDLHRSMALEFMFELLAGGVVEHVAERLKNSGVLFGFGGIAPVGCGAVPGEMLIGEHVRLGSQCVILSRDFPLIRQSGQQQALTKLDLEEEIRRLRMWEQRFREADKETLERNAQECRRLIWQLARQRRKTRHADDLPVKSMPLPLETQGNHQQRPVREVAETGTDESSEKAA